MLRLELDGQAGAETAEPEISTGIAFFDHMLTLFARHGLFGLSVQATGDLAVDYHHTVEDTGIVLGEAFREALGDKRGINRYGFFLLPMDETLVRVAVDLSGRPCLVYAVRPVQVMVRDFNIGLVKEFLAAFANALGANIHVVLEHGEDPHHIAEAIFKGLARSLDVATALDPRQEGSIASTKGVL